MNSNAAATGRVALAVALAGLFAHATAASHSEKVSYPGFATAAAPKVIAEVNGVKVYGGGFGSALAIDPRSPSHFDLLTDRGPNTDNDTPDQKVFPVPKFTPQIGRFRLQGDKLVLVKTIELRDAKGRKVTGRARARWTRAGGSARGEAAPRSGCG